MQTAQKLVIALNLDPLLLKGVVNRCKADMTYCLLCEKTKVSTDALFLGHAHDKNTVV